MKEPPDKLPVIDLDPSEYRVRRMTFPPEWPMLTIGLALGAAAMTYVFLHRFESENPTAFFAFVSLVSFATGGLFASLFRRWL